MHTWLDFPKIKVPACTILLSVPNMLTLSLSAFGTLFKYANSLLKLTHRRKKLTRRRKKLAHRRKNHALQRKAGAEKENTM